MKTKTIIQMAVMLLNGYSIVATAVIIILKIVQQGQLMTPIEFSALMTVVTALLLRMYIDLL